MHTPDVIDQSPEVLMGQVGDVVSEVIGKTISDSEANLIALGLDSLTLLEILATLEEKFGIILNEGVIEEFQTIARITRVVEDAVRAFAAE